MTPRASLVPLVAGVLAVGAGSLARPGYTPDEEYTLFAVRGIAAHGLPLLPSGLLYDRGLLYSYASWLAGALTGLDLPAFRALSLLCAAATLAAIHHALRRHVSSAAAAAATAMAATALPFWTAATSGRFYAPFLLTWATALAVLARGLDHRQPRPGRWWLPTLAALAFASRLTHELAFLLLALPVAAVSASAASSWNLGLGAWAGTGPSAAPSGIGASAASSAIGASAASCVVSASAASSVVSASAAAAALRASAALAGGLSAAQALLFAAHFVMPRPDTGGEAMIERFFLWQVLNLFERPTGAPLGVVLAALVVAWLLAPAAWRRSLTAASTTAAAIALVAVGREAASAGLGSATVGAALAGSLHYPLDMFWHMAAADPMVVTVALALLLARMLELGGEWPIRERVPHLLWVGWVLWFGVIESGITTNYLLLPTVGVMTAIGIDLVALGEQVGAIRPGRRAQTARAALTGIALLVVADQWSGTGSLADRLAAARPTIVIDGIEEVGRAIGDDDRVACTDELACLLLVGRADRWLALDDYVRERFVLSRGGTRVGVYAGAAAVFRPRELFAPGPDGRPPARVVVVDLFRDYPVGNSAPWLPRAAAADGLAMRPLLVTPRARVVELRPSR